MSNRILILENEFCFLRDFKKSNMILILQIISQITGEELGSQEIRVAKNKETIRDMRVRVLSGLQLTMNADQAGGPDKRRWVAKTEFSNVLTSKYQVKFLYTLTTTSLP